ncbi:MAG: hypothetical protein ACYDGL_14220 [Bellilinea sp.]
MFPLSRTRCPKQLDGCKLHLADGWVMFRASGIEPIVGIYVEANDPKRLREILDTAVRYANNA